VPAAIREERQDAGLVDVFERLHRGEELGPQAVGKAAVRGRPLRRLGDVARDDRACWWHCSRGEYVSELRQRDHVWLCDVRRQTGRRVGVDRVERLGLEQRVRERVELLCGGR
jgi:hypothetical protein